MYLFVIIFLLSDSLDRWSKETTPINHIFGGYFRTQSKWYTDDCVNHPNLNRVFGGTELICLFFRLRSNLFIVRNGIHDISAFPGYRARYSGGECRRWSSTSFLQRRKFAELPMWDVRNVSSGCQENIYWEISHSSLYSIEKVWYIVPLV